MTYVIILVIIGSGDGSVLDSAKALPEPMLISFQLEPGKQMLVIF